MNETKVFKMFGKKLSELTQDEKRLYQRTCKAEFDARKKRRQKRQQVSKQNELIASLQAKIEELEQKIIGFAPELEPKKNIWIPEKDEYYWAISSTDIHTFRNLEDGNDRTFFEAGVCFKTKEEAEFELKREKYTRLFRQYVKQNDGFLDWNNLDTPKYYVWFNHSQNTILFGSVHDQQDAFQIYATNKMVLQDAIEFVGEDNFKKYVLEV